APLDNQNAAASEQLGGKNVGGVDAGVDDIPRPVGRLEPDQSAAWRGLVDDEARLLIAIHIEDRAAFTERSGRAGGVALAVRERPPAQAIAPCGQLAADEGAAGNA